MLTRARVKAALVLLALTSYGAACLYPYSFSLPRQVHNQAERTPAGTLAFPGPGVAVTTGPLDWLLEVDAISRLELQVTARSWRPDQQGPARILTISAGPSERNLTVGQQGAALVLRVRRPGSTPNGTPAYEVADVFGTPDWRTILVRLEDERLTLSVDGITRIEETYSDPPLRDWDWGYPLAMGNEPPLGRLGDDRAWIGEIREALVRINETEIDYLEETATEQPKDWWERPPPRAHSLDLDRTLTFYRDSDIALNLLGFMPFGALLILLYGRHLSVTRIAGYGALLSLSIELLQIALPMRHPSLTDLLVNTLGAGLGAYLMRRVLARRILRRVPP